MLRHAYRHLKFRKGTYMRVQVVPEEEEVSLTSCNADLLEDIGQKWAFALDEAIAEALSVFPEVMEDEDQALLLVGSLVAVMAITEDPYS